MSTSIVWPAIFATFYFSDSERSADTKAKRLMRHLAQELGLSAGSDPETWRGEDAQRQIRYRMRGFTPYAKDVRVVQLVVSDIPQNRAAADGWQIMLDRLEDLLNNETLGNLFGYTFTYQAVIPDPSATRQRGRLINRLRTFSNLLTAIDWAPLLALTRRLHQPDDDKSSVLAENMVLNGQGKLWLLNIPNLNQPTSKQHVEKGTVYLALSLASANNEMVNEIIYEQSATLFMPDLIAHKGYNQIRNYRLHDKQQNISTQITSLNYNVKQQEQNIQSIADFDKLRISLARQLYNYNLAMQSANGGAVLAYHLAQLEPRHKELEFIVEEGQNILQATDTAIAIQQTRLEWRISIIFGLLGIGLAISQIVDIELANAFLTWSGWLEPQAEYPRFCTFLVQLGITAAIVALVVLLWLLFELITSAWSALRRLKELIVGRG